MKRIIIEGPDGAGKSTLINLLKSYKPGHFKTIINEKGPEQDFDSWWPDVLTQQSAGTPLHDRFFYSELVYGPLLRGSLKPDMQLTRSIQLFLREHALLIYCRPPVWAIEQALNVNLQMEGVTENITRLIEAYDKLMMQEMSFFEERFLLYDWTRTGSLDAAVLTVRGYLAGETT